MEERAMLAATADANARLVADLYADVLGRLAAPADIAYWHDQLASGQPVDNVVVGFVRSVEHRQQVVSHLYQQYLGRTTDQAGLDYWVNVLGNGTSEFALLSQIISSDEYFHLQGGDNVGFVSGLYREVLHRADFGLPEIAYWAGLLGNGTSRSSVAQGIIDSDEFIGVGVNQMYRDFLKRDAEADGQAYWLSRFHQGANTFEIERGLLDSAEYAAQAQRQLEPGAPLVLLAPNLDPTAKLTVEFSDQHGFKLDLPTLTSDTSSASVIVPPLIDPATGQFATGTVSVQLLENGLPVATFGARQILTPSASSFTPGTVILAYLNGALQQLSAVEAQSVGTSFDTPSLKADLAAQQSNLSQLAADVQAVMTDSSKSFALGSFAGQQVTLGSAQLAALDQLTLAALDGIRLNASFPASAQLAAAAEANPTAATMAALVAGPAATNAARPDSLNSISAAMWNFSLSIEASALAGTVLAPPLLGTPLAAIIFGSGTLVQGLGYSVAASDPAELGQLRSTVERATQSANGVLASAASQPTGAIGNDLSNQNDALHDYQTAGPQGQFFFIGADNLIMLASHPTVGAFFEVRLNKRPAGSVTLTLGNDRPDLGSMTPATLVWNNDEAWDAPRTVLVTPTNILSVGEDQTLHIKMGSMLTTDPADKDIQLPNPNEVTITDLNYNVAGVTVKEVLDQPLNTGEDSTATFHILLLSKPTADVNVVVRTDSYGAFGIVESVDDSLLSTIDGGTLTTFTPANWNQPQLVTIRGVGDATTDAAPRGGGPPMGEGPDDKLSAEPSYNILLYVIGSGSDDPVYAAQNDRILSVHAVNLE